MKYWSHIQLEGKYSLDSTDPRESEIPPAAAGAGHRRWQRRGPAPAGRGPGRGLRPCPAFRFIVRKTLTYLRHALSLIHI